MSSTISTHASGERATQMRTGHVNPTVPTGWVRRVALAGIVAPAGFFTVMMVLGLVTPGYDWIARYGSELSLGKSPHLCHQRGQRFQLFPEGLDGVLGHFAFSNQGQPGHLRAPLKRFTPVLCDCFITFP